MNNVFKIEVKWFVVVFNIKMLPIFIERIHFSVPNHFQLLPNIYQTKFMCRRHSKKYKKTVIRDSSCMRNVGYSGLLLFIQAHSGLK